MNWSKKSKIIYIIMFLGFIGALIVKQFIYKKHPRIEGQKASFVGKVDEFKTKIIGQSQGFKADDIVELNGIISELNEESVLLDQTVYCQFTNVSILKSFSLNQAVNIKGRFIGFDDLLEEIKLDQCILLSNNKDDEKY